jgi:hypothetical protein
MKTRSRQISLYNVYTGNENKSPLRCKGQDSKAREINNFNKLENDGGQLATKIGSLSKGAYLLN